MDPSPESEGGDQEVGGEGALKEEDAEKGEEDVMTPREVALQVLVSKLQGELEASVLARKELEARLASMEAASPPPPPTTTSTAQDTKMPPPSPSGLTEEGQPQSAFDLAGFANRWQLWRSFVELQRSQQKKKVAMPMVDRGDVLKVLLSVVGGKTLEVTTLVNLFRPLVISFEGEEVLDYGGATHEALSLFFEQVKDLSVDVRMGRWGKAGMAFSYKLFEVEEGGGVYLPTVITAHNRDLADTLHATTEVQFAYFNCGRVMAKAVGG